MEEVEFSWKSSLINALSQLSLASKNKLQQYKSERKRCKNKLQQTNQKTIMRWDNVKIWIPEFSVGVFYCGSELVCILNII